MVNSTNIHAAIMFVYIIIKQIVNVNLSKKKQKRSFSPKLLLWTLTEYHTKLGKNLVIWPIFNSSDNLIVTKASS